jgi:erythromycin esterase-like protein
MEAVLEYLEKIDPVGAQRARARYSCFDHFGEDTQAYGYATAFGISDSCESEVVGQLVEMQKRAAELANLDGRVARDDFFFAQQNARLVKNAEQYYRTMYRSDVSSWNLRDRHMAETLVAFEKHLEGDAGRPAKIVIWAHNSHVGDARATEMGARGEWNLGQLVREIYRNGSFSIGFTTNWGTVTASSDWGGPAERMRVRPALAGSVEEIFHDSGIGRFALVYAENTAAKEVFSKELLERAIGVIYRPETERQSHYFNTLLAGQFDAVIHIDETRAVEPLERSVRWDRGEVMETYPSGV